MGLEKQGFSLRKISHFVRNDTSCDAATTGRSGHVISTVGRNPLSPAFRSAAWAVTPRAIRTAIAAGVKVIEHGQLSDEASVKLMADLLLVDGDPVANIKLIEDPARNFLVIMKDGTLHKNLAR